MAIMTPTGSLLAAALLALAAALSGAGGESSFQDLVAVDCQGADIDNSDALNSVNILDLKRLSENWLKTDCM